MKSQVMKNRIHLAAHPILPMGNHGRPSPELLAATEKQSGVEELGQKGMVLSGCHGFFTLCLLTTKPCHGFLTSYQLASFPSILLMQNSS